MFNKKLQGHVNFLGVYIPLEIEILEDFIKATNSNSRFSYDDKYITFKITKCEKDYKVGDIYTVRYLKSVNEILFTLSQNQQFQFNL